MELIRWLLVSLALSLAAHGAVAETPQNLRENAERIGKMAIIPAYERLEAAARTHQEAWQKTCTGDRMAKALAPSFHALADSWSRIEFLRYGPAGHDFRAERFNYFPEMRNATTRGLAALLAEKPEALTLERVRQGSAAVQGLPVLERLIFGPPPPAHLEPQACALGQAVATNLLRMSTEMVEGWHILTTKASLDKYMADEMISRVITDMMAWTEELVDRKLSPAMGDDARTARPQRLEGWRSGRTRAVFTLPLESMAPIVRAVAGRGDDAALQKRLKDSRNVIAAQPEDFTRLLADSATWPKALIVKKALKDAQNAMVGQLPDLADVQAGFSANDGD